MPIQNPLRAVTLSCALEFVTQIRTPHIEKARPRISSVRGERWGGGGWGGAGRSSAALRFTRNS